MTLNMAKSRELTKAGIMIVIEMIVITVILAFFIRPVTVDGNSMENTFHSGQLLAIQEFNFHPKQQDIVVTTDKNPIGKSLIKRVIAVGGQTINVDYKTNSVYVDNVKITEPYIKETMMSPSISERSYPFKIPAGYVFLMGDNRNVSNDSRNAGVGPIPTTELVGKVMIK